MRGVYANLVSNARALYSKHRGRACHVMSYRAMPCHASLGLGLGRRVLAIPRSFGNRPRIPGRELDQDPPPRTLVADALYNTLVRGVRCRLSLFVRLTLHVCVASGRPATVVSYFVSNGMVPAHTTPQQAFVKA